MIHRIPKLEAMAATLAVFAKTATEEGELGLAAALIEAMKLARERAESISAEFARKPDH